MLSRSALKALMVYWVKLSDLWFPWLASVSQQNDAWRK